MGHTTKMEMMFEFSAARQKAELTPTKPPTHGSRSTILSQIFTDHHVLTQLGVPRQPVLILEGYMHVPELEGTRVPLGHSMDLGVS